MNDDRWIVVDGQACDEDYMRWAIQLAKQGASLGEVPVGALIVHDEKIVGWGFNQPICSKDSTAHAEIIAIRQACQYFNNYRLPKGCTLYVTLEPCTMCLGAIIHARIERVVFGAFEPKAGVIVSQENILNKHYFNHKIQAMGGILSDECSFLLKDFFQARRMARKMT